MLTIPSCNGRHSLRRTTARVRAVVRPHMPVSEIDRAAQEAAERDQERRCRPRASCPPAEKAAVTTAGGAAEAAAAAEATACEGDPSVQRRNELAARMRANSTDEEAWRQLVYEEELLLHREGLFPDLPPPEPPAPSKAAEDSPTAPAEAAGPSSVAAAPSTSPLLLSTLPLPVHPKQPVAPRAAPPAAPPAAPAASAEPPPAATPAAPAPAPAPAPKPPAKKLDLDNLFGEKKTEKAASQPKTVDLFSSSTRPAGSLFGGASSKRNAPTTSKAKGGSLFGDDDDPLFAK